MTDIQLANILADRGMKPDTARLNPSDMVNIHLRLRRDGDRRVLHTGRVTVREAAHRITEVIRDGWTLSA